MIEQLQEEAVSVPIRGLFNLTKEFYVLLDKNNRVLVSVPIRGLFNLTSGVQTNEEVMALVSVPIRGLFNLTAMTM